MRDTQVHMNTRVLWNTDSPDVEHWRVGHSRVLGHNDRERTHQCRKVWERPLRGMWSSWPSTFFCATDRRTVLPLTSVSMLQGPLHYWLLWAGKETLMVCTHHNPKPLLTFNPGENLWSIHKQKVARGWEAGHIRRAAVGAASHILQRNSSSKSPTTRKINKELVNMRSFLRETALELRKCDLTLKF